jgi:hypothetical protein
MKIPDEFIEEAAELYRLKKQIIAEEKKCGIFKRYIRWAKDIHPTFEMFLLYKWGMKCKY